jgi:hypothetical protein
VAGVSLPRVLCRFLASATRGTLQCPDVLRYIDQDHVGQTYSDLLPQNVMDLFIDPKPEKKEGEEEKEEEDDDAYSTPSGHSVHEDAAT